MKATSTTSRSNIKNNTVQGLTVSSSRIPQKTTSLSVSKLADDIAKLNIKTNNSGLLKQKQPVTIQQNVYSQTMKISQVEKKPTTLITTRISKTPPKEMSVNGNPKTTSLTTKQNKTNPEKRVPTPPGMISCRICGRHFNQDRIDRHQEICAKTVKKKRRVFDPVKHRLRGTEAESMIAKIKNDTKRKPVIKKTNWRKQHEEFVANIRAARMVKEHLAKGGKLSELPPPPPLDTSDYVQCPHCGRKFNQTAAERHIPKCVNIRHNKPKPALTATNSNKISMNKATTRKR